MFRDHKGHEFHTFKDMCEFWNLKVPTVKKRMDLHWGLERALTISPNKNIEIIYKGVTYLNIHEACNALGLNEYKAKNLYYYHKQSYQKVFDSMLNKSKKFVYQGKCYSTQKELCDAVGILPATFSGRRKRNSDIETIEDTINALLRNRK